MYKHMFRVARASARLVNLQAGNTSTLVSRYSTAAPATTPGTSSGTRIFQQHVKGTTLSSLSNDDIYTAKPPTIEYLLTPEEKFERLDVEHELAQFEHATLPENQELSLHYKYDSWWFNDMLNIHKLTIPQAEKLVQLAKAKGEFELMYSQLSHVYSRNGQVDGVRSVARQFEEDGGELDEDYHRDLMYAHFVNGKYDLAHVSYLELLNEGFRPQYSGYLIELEVLEKLGKSELIPALIDDIRKDGHVIPDKYKTEEDRKPLDI